VLTRANKSKRAALQRPSPTLSLRSSLLRFPIDMARQLLLLLGADAAFAALTDTATFRSITVNGGGAEKPSLFHMVRHSSAACCELGCPAARIDGW